MFNGDWYESWKIKTKVFFLSHWDIVENGFVYIGDLTNLSAHQKSELMETRKKDSKALLVMQEAVNDS